MTYLQRLHWEHGEQHPDLSNVAASKPVVDEVTASDSYSGSYCQRYSFNTSDTVAVYNDTVFERATALTPVLMGVAFKRADLSGSKWDDFRFYLHGDSSSSDTIIEFEVEPTGAITVARGNSASSFGTVLGATAAGVITPGTWHYMSVRVIFDDTVGEVQVHVDGAEVLNLTGIDTNYTGTQQTAWGWGMYFDTSSSGPSGEDVFLDDIVLADDMASPFAPQMHEALVPTGVTASNDGTLFGGAANAAAATDEIPGTSADGFTLGTVGHKQGLSFPSRSGTGTIRGVQVWGQVGDSAGGSEQLTCDLNDGTATEAGAAIPLSAAFASRELTTLINDPPGGGSWDDTKLDATTIEFERTA